MLAPSVDLSDRGFVKGGTKVKNKRNKSINE